MSSGSRARRPALNVILGAFVVAAACNPPSGGTSVSGLPRPTPAPVFAGISSASHADLVNYCDGLVFDSTAPGMDLANFATSAGMSHVRAEPEIGAARVTRAALAEGRIIGRLVTTGAASPLPTRVGTTCIAVDSSSSAGWRVIRFPTDTALIVGAPIRLLPFSSGDTSFMRIDGGKLYAAASCDKHTCPFADASTLNCYWDEAQQAWVCPTKPTGDNKNTPNAGPIPRGPGPIKE